MDLCGRQPRCSPLDNNVSLGDSSWAFPRQLFLSFPARVFSWQKSHGCFLSSYCHHLRKISSNSNDGFMGKVQAINEVSATDGKIKYLAQTNWAGNDLFFGWLHAHVWLQESSFGDQGISQTNLSVFS